jgi:inosine-uridine nucleoside N-ribohydrolase
MTQPTPLSRRWRAIVNTDAKNEADDQFAIVHALLSPSLDVRGVIPAHFGLRSQTSLEDSRAEVDFLLSHMGMGDSIRVENGARCALADVTTPVPSDGARLIIEEALREDAGPLFVAFLGPLTDMASALLMTPEIADRDVTVIWIGGPPYDDAPPAYWPEFNLSNDVVAANVVFRSELAVWQVPMSTYVTVAVSYAELRQKVAPCGELGEYLVTQLIDWNERNTTRPMEFRSLGDSPAIGVMINPFCGRFTHRPAPTFTTDAAYDFSNSYRPIRVYDTIDARFILEDFFAKLRLFTAGTISPRSA